MIRQYKSACSEALEEYKFSPAEIDVLMFLSNNKAYDTARDISEFRGISKALVSRSVDTLIRRKFIVTVIDANDHRIIHLRLTDLATPIVKRLANLRELFKREVFSGVSQTDKVVFDQVLNTMISNSMDTSRIKD
ncbi:MAG: MarR family winged helix-turn-helix transcriptional regulator [Sphaerochaetaceae bacterium]|nr:MarR family winged helix-turn-helix transcriptional regulator [Sphaerochaetaceae bacterium]